VAAQQYGMVDAISTRTTDYDTSKSIARVFGVTPHTPNHTPNQLSGSLCRRDRRTESSMARLSAVLFVREPKEIFLLSTR